MDFWKGLTISQIFQFDFESIVQLCYFVLSWLVITLIILEWWTGWLRKNDSFWLRIFIESSSSFFRSQIFPLSESNLTAKINSDCENKLWLRKKVLTAKKNFDCEKKIWLRKNGHHFWLRNTYSPKFSIHLRMPSY